MSGVYFAYLDPILTCGDCPIRDCDGYCPRFEMRTREDMKPFSECGITHIPANARVIVACPETFPTPYRKELNDYMRGWNACLRSVMQSALPKEQGGQE